MSIRVFLGIALLAHAAFVAFQLVSNFGDLQQTVLEYSAPHDPFWLIVGVAAFNVLLIFAAICLGSYLMTAGEAKLVFVIPLVIVVALYGGYSLVLGVAILCWCIAERYRSSRI